MARPGSVLNSGVDRLDDHTAAGRCPCRYLKEEALNATPSPEPRSGVDPAAPGAAGDTLPPDEARQGEVVFAKPWKRQIFFAVVAAVAVIGLVLIIAFT